MSTGWAAAFDGELAEHLPPKSSDRVRVPFPAVEHADRDLADLVLEQPEDAQSAAEGALEELGYDAAFRVYDIPERRTFRVGKYGSEWLGSLIAVRGTVVSVDGVKPFVNHAAYECSRCGEVMYVSQPGGRIIKADECRGCERSKGGLTLDIGESDVVDHQAVVLKRANSSMDDPPIETVWLWDDLCETVSKDDLVTIVGVYDTLPWPDEVLLKTYIDAVSINKSEQPATVDEVADWRVQKWTYEAADELCDAGSNYDTSTRAVVDQVSDEHGVADGEIHAAISELEEESILSEHRDGRVHITTSSPPTFEPE